MPSAFAHTLVAVTLGQAFKKELTSWKFWLLGIFCSVIPDADVIAFSFGIPYEHMFGHRGFFHSFFFALLLAVLITLMFYRNTSVTNTKGMALILFFFICGASHGILDAMTDGGRGIAFFAPFENTRYFLPWRPIEVSPIGVGDFFTGKGIKVLKSEIVWIGVPCLVIILLFWAYRKIKTKAGHNE